MAKVDQDTIKQIEIARKKLLDLTMRNSLLNFKHSERAVNQIRVVDNSICDIYNDLIEEKNIELTPLPELPSEPKDEQTAKFINAFELALVSDEKYLEEKEKLEKSDNQLDDAEEKLIRELKNRVRETLGLPPYNSNEISKKEWAKEQHINPNYDNIIESSFAERKSKNYLQTMLYPKELKNKVVSLKRIVKSDREEKGTNTFYIAFGFLEWYDQVHSEIKHLAPLLLLRLDELEQDKRRKISIKAAGDPISTNLSLQEKLKEFQLNLPEYEEDDTPETYLKKISKIIKVFPKWKVRSYITIGRFIFSRLAMYEDLNIRNWTALLSNKSSLLSTLFNTQNCVGSSEFIYDIDKNNDVKKYAPILITSADSSQHSAIVDVMKNKNLVIKGPPGTGKSQTITNLIANALYANKKVLFMAEKKAALDVVFSRLKHAGLEDYCFELHSDKTNISHVRNELERSYARYRSFKHKSKKEISTTKINKLLQEKKAIRNYYDILQTKIGKLEKTIFDLIWSTKNFEKDIKKYPVSIKNIAIPNVLKLTEIDFEKENDELTKLENLEEKCQRGLEGLNDTWKDISSCDISVTEVPSLLYQIEPLVENLKNFIIKQEELSSQYYLNTPFSIEKEEQLFEYIKDLGKLLCEENISLNNLKSLEKQENYLLIEELTNLLQTYEALFLKLKEIYHDPQKIADDIDNYTVIFEAMTKSNVEIETLENIVKSKDKYEEELKNWNNCNNLKEIATLVFEKNEFIVSELCAIKEILNSFVKASNLLPLYSSSELFKPYNWNTLDKIAMTVEQLKSEKQILSTQFDMEAVLEYPNIEKQVDHAIVNISTSGLFGFLKAGYIEAKKIYRVLSYDKNTSKTVMLENYKKLHKYLKQYRSFEKNKTYQNLLESYFDDIENTICDIQTVKTFYENLNQIDVKYGSQISGVLKKFFLKKENFDYFQKVINLSISCTNFETSIDIKNPVIIEDHIHTLSYKYELAKLLTDGYLDVFQNNQISIQKILSERLSLAELNVLKKDIEKLSLDLSSIIPDLANGLQSNINKLTNLLKIGQILYNKDYITNKNEFIRLLVADQYPHIYKNSQQQNEDILNIKKAIEAITELFIFGGSDFKEQQYISKNFEDIIDYLNELLLNRDTIYNICSFYDNLKEIKNKRYASTVSYLRENKYSLKNVSKIYSYLVYYNLLKMNNDTDWSTYIPNGLCENVKNIQQLEKEVYDLNGQLLLAQLNAIPVPDGINAPRVSEKTELQLILHQISGHARRIPLRRFLKRAGKAIQALKPCFLMSPIAVAQYIPPQSLTFDLLIIDEASQMYLEEALGGVFRAKQVVVVGDDKQLPPTPFFQKSLNQDDDFEEEDNMIEDLSVLDTCIVRGFENRELLWHYRSKDTSLIAFSNKNFYNDNLKLFPTPVIKSDMNGIQYVYVGGIYRARQNEEEADAIIKEIQHFVRKYPDKSLGIATMNTTQKMLLEKKCDQLYEQDTAFQKYCDKWNNGLEAFFVKNLENVQGDERDYIFVSTVYGPETKGGRVLQRFGPINGKYGHRRLNVLFTRAKFGLKLFTSLHSQDIVASESSTIGLKIFKDYLLYAETGKIDNDLSARKLFDSEFEKMVYDILANRGYELDTQIGVKGFFVDLAVKHPKNKDFYALGIECDGARYHSTKSARDRDCIRQSVLESLGWKIYRIWSKDWYYNTEREIEKLLSYIETAVKEKPSVEYAINENYKDIHADRNQKEFAFDNEFSIKALKEVEDSSQNIPISLKEKSPRMEFLWTKNKTEISTAQEKRIDVFDKVKYVRLSDNTEHIVQITNRDSDPEKGLINKNTALAQALIDAEEGEEIEVNDKIFKIKEIIKEQLS